MSSGFKLNLAVFHAFFFQKGGAEKFVFNVRNHFNADLFAGAVNFKYYNYSGEDYFSKELFNEKFRLSYLHRDLNAPIVRVLKRYLFFIFSRKIKMLVGYDAVIFSGNIFFLQKRLKKLCSSKNCHVKPLFIAFVHSPPRFLTDQRDNFANSFPVGIRSLFRFVSKFLLREYLEGMKCMDIIFTNSANTQKRIGTYLGLESEVTYVPVETNKFRFISCSDYYFSYARLEEMKRIPLILEAFARMPDKKLIIASSGPLKDWVLGQIAARNLTNITFEGLVSEERLVKLVGNCTAGIYIPVDEDFGMTQIEFMSAGKPVIGVKEGGLIETVIDGKTGLLLPPNPTVDELISGVRSFDCQRALSMRETCIIQAGKFSSERFYEYVENRLLKLSAEKND
jgi:glycosyltransferase involved in cell wall biosynthesis